MRHRKEMIMEDSPSTLSVLMKAFKEVRAGGMTFERVQKFFGYQIKKIRNYPIPYVHLNEQWFKDIVDCQREIRCLSQADYHGKPRYERSWWLHIPKWIREDWLGRPVENCIDVGCGYGTLALYCRRLLNCSVYCIDFREILSPLLAKKYGIKFSLCNAEIEPFPWNLNFDIIVFTEILEHLNFHPTPTLRLLRARDDKIPHWNRQNATS